jgi:hypothetical protein
MTKQVVTTVIAIALVLGLSVAAQAQEPGAAKANLSTDLRFNEMDVKGKYQYADEALALVEDEKGLDDLLGLRSDFRDRLKRETKRK